MPWIQNYAPCKLTPITQRKGEAMARRVHDRGGWPDAGPIDRTEHVYSMWEKRTDAIRGVLGAKGLIRTDELRRAIESIEPAQYTLLRYYERWIVGIETLLIEKGLLTREELDRKMEESVPCWR
jgi:Nitrile hydratase beta subunit, N-terminal